MPVATDFFPAPLISSIVTFQHMRRLGNTEATYICIEGHLITSHKGCHIDDSGEGSYRLPFGDERRIQLS